MVVISKAVDLDQSRLARGAALAQIQEANTSPSKAR